MSKLKIFGLGSSQGFAEQVAESIPSYDLDFGHKFNDIKLSLVKEIRHPDGEAYTASLDNVRGCDVFVISSLYGDSYESPDEKMMKLFLFINTLRHASADRITVVCPYLSYMRQDRKTESRAPIATQAVAIMLESLGAKRVLSMDVHNLGAEQNAFRIPIDNLEAKKLLADSIANEVRGVNSGEYVVMTPDAGGAKRAKAFQASLEKRVGKPVGFAYADKTRIGGEQVAVKIIGNIEGKKVIVVDDMISTGKTAGEIESGVREAGGELWALAATHGLFTGNAPEWLKNIPRIFVTDTIHTNGLLGTKIQDNVRIAPTVGMFAKAIQRIHSDGGSISKLLED